MYGGFAITKSIFYICVHPIFPQGITNVKGKQEGSGHVAAVCVCVALGWVGDYGWLGH